MKETRQRYYAALEHEGAAQRLFDGQSDSGGSAPGTGLAFGESPAALHGVPAPSDVYSELGMQVYRAVESLLGNLSGWARSGGADGAQVRRAVSELIQPLVRDIEGLSGHLQRQDVLLNEIAAGIRRIDRFTLEAFQRMRGRGGYGESVGDGPLGAGGPYGRPGPNGRDQTEGTAVEPPKRLAKEETVARALEAARYLRSQGRKLTLKSVAEAAGLKYSQIVYAFGSKEEMLDRVSRQEMNVANAS